VPSDARHMCHFTRAELESECSVEWVIRYIGKVQHEARQLSDHVIRGDSRRWRVLVACIGVHDRVATAETTRAASFL